MESSDIIVIVVLAVFVIYGIATLILAPIILRRFYQEHDFRESGRSEFESFDSLLLNPLATKHIYQGSYQGYQLRHAKCLLQDRPLFTFSKRVRKQMQARWSITHLIADRALPEFALLPKTDPETIALMLSDPGVDLSADSELERRYLLQTENKEAVKQLISTEIRPNLTDRELIAVEVFDRNVVIRRNWPAEKLNETLVGDLDCAVRIAQCLG